MDIEELINDPVDGEVYRDELRELIDQVDQLQMTLCGMSSEMKEALGIDGTESLDDLESITGNINLDEDG